MYRYSKFIEKYSPIDKEGYFGVFEFHFESSNDYVSDMLEAVAMEIFIFNNKIVIGTRGQVIYCIEIK